MPTATIAAAPRRRGLSVALCGCTRPCVDRSCVLNGAHRIQADDASTNATIALPVTETSAPHMRAVTGPLAADRGVLRPGGCSSDECSELRNRRSEERRVGKE